MFHSGGTLKASSSFLLFLCICFSAPCFSLTPYPVKPELSVTPGDLCDQPDGYRYPEKVPYCERDVESSRKDAIIDLYDRSFGYQIRSYKRQDFKIDHLIPLCMGGSNRNENLWPQHVTVYEVTDPWEQKLCAELASGEITQQQAIDEIFRVKLSVQSTYGLP